MAIYTDNFTEGGSNVALTSHTPDSGGSWSTLLDTTSAGSALTVIAATDVLSPTGGTNSARLAATVSWTPLSADYYVRIVMAAASTGDDAFWLIARCADASNFYAAVFYGGATTVYIIKVVAGVVTDLTSASVTIGNSDTLTFNVVGTSLTVDQNGSQILSTTDSALTAAGVGGIGFGNIRNATDDVNTGVDITQFVLFDIVAGQPTIRRFGSAPFIASQRPIGRAGGTVHAPLAKAA